MPELPEVELYGRYFASHALRQRISGVEVLDERILGETRSETFRSELRGRTFTEVRRHGKHLFVRAGRNLWLHLHFGMTGDLTWYHRSVKPPRFARVIFHFEENRHLAFEDMRLFGVVDLTTSPDDFISRHHLGPDPLESSFTLAVFRRILEKRRGSIKALLMSQENIAGIGNLYADETLYETSIHPQRSVDSLTSAEVRSILAAMRRILRTTIARKGRGSDYPRSSLIPHREKGERCPRCGGPIRRIVVAGRTTYFCAKHQT